MNIDEMQVTLDKLGIKIISVRGDEIQAHCPAHKERMGREDNNPSWWINSVTGQHICFSCNFKGGLYGLIAYVGGVEASGAVEWLKSSDSFMRRFNKLNEKTVVKDDAHTVSASMLSAFVEPPEEALLSRGLTKTASFIYQLLWSTKQDCWVLPVRDAYTSKLIGWQEKGYMSRYFNNYPAKMKKSRSLFGYQQYFGGDLVVVESPLDVARLYSVGVKGGVATYGTAISEFQFNVIRGADRVIFALDNDSAGKQASHNAYEFCKRLDMEAWFFNYSHTDMKDVGAMSRDEILTGIESAKHIANGIKVLI